MAIHDKDLIEALSSTSILTSMITPAVLISACGTLLFSTSARLGRIFDRVHLLKMEIESVLAGKATFPEERIIFSKNQVATQRVRAALIQKALACLYIATALFIASSLAIALNVAYGGPETAWIPTIIALSGGLFLFAASALLIYENRFNLNFINRHIEFVTFLHGKYADQKRDDKK
jgi:hypothetical protein